MRQKQREVKLSQTAKSRQSKKPQRQTKRKSANAKSPRTKWHSIKKNWLASSLIMEELANCLTSLYCSESHTVMEPRCHMKQVEELQSQWRYRYICCKCIYCEILKAIVVWHHQIGDSAVQTQYKFLTFQRQFSTAQGKAIAILVQTNNVAN